DVDDPVGRVPLIVLVDALDEGGRDVGARALHDDRDVLVGRRLEREQGLGRLRLVVEGDQLELLAEGAPAAVDVVDDVLELLQVLIADLGEGAREGVGVHDLDGPLGVGGPGGEREGQGQERGADPLDPVERGVKHGASSLSGAARLRPVAEHGEGIPTARGKSKGWPDSPARRRESTMAGMLNVLVTTLFDRTQLDRLRAVSPEISVSQADPDAADYAKTHVLYAGAPPRDLSRAPALRWVQLHMAGVNALADHPLYTDTTLPLTTTSGVHAATIAEYA